MQGSMFCMCTLSTVISIEVLLSHKHTHTHTHTHTHRIILPLAQSYVLASYFSIWKKVLRALIENALFYVTFFIIFLILFIYLVVVEKIITSL